jgi:hypothetical protein
MQGNKIIDENSRGDRVATVEDIGGPLTRLKFLRLL